MACSNRQLSQDQREAGFEALRNAGAVQAIRPFSGKASPENLVDYLNREVFPVLKQTRKAVNDVYRPVLDNAPSGNPLRYLFSSSVVAADPTAGFLRLDNADASLATTIRVNESNSGLQNVVPWLDVMAGSATAPLGVVTVFHQGDPTRFARYDLTAMVDQGSYWDLTVTAVEVSSITPFQDGDDVAVSFIPGVAGSGAGAIPVGGVGVAVSAAGSSQSSGTVVWSNSNNVSFGMNGATVTATATFDGLRTVALFPQGVAQALSVTAATDSTVIGTAMHFPLLATINQTRISSGNVLWRISSNSMLGVALQNYLAAGGTNQAAEHVSFSNANGVAWGISSTTVANFGIVPIVTASYTVPAALAVSAAGASASSGTVVWSNSNNVSFGQAGSTITASATVASTADPQIGLVSHIGGQSVSSVTRMVFSDASNVTWTLSTAANAVTVRASVAAAGGGGITAFPITGAASSVAATILNLSNANGFSWLLSTGASVATLSASYTVPTHTLAVSAAGASASNGTVVLSNSNNVSFGQAGSTITASATVAATREIGVVSHVGGNTVSSASRLAFSNASGVTWSLSTAANAATVLASVNDQSIAIVSHVGGNSVSAVTRLAFSNASNVTWSLSTAAGAATVLASVAAGGGGGIALAVDPPSDTATSGTVVFSNEASVTNFAFGSILAQNVVHSLNGSVMGATALFRVQDGTNSTQTGGQLGTKIQFVSSNGVSFGIASTSDAQGRNIIVTASVAAIPTIQPAQYFRNFVNISSSQVVALAGRSNSMMLFPLGFAPFPGNLTASAFDMIISGAAGTTTNSSYGMTVRGGVYTLANSTQLSLVNSFSFSSSGQSTASANRASSVQGIRWLVLSTSNWSSSPAFSLGANYWMLVGFRFGAIGSLVFPQWGGHSGPSMNVGANFAGTLGVAGTASIVSRFSPFIGSINTTSPPTTIGTAALLCDVNMSVWHPFVQLRDVFQ